MGTATTKPGRTAATRRPLRAVVYIRVSSYDVAADEAANQSPEVQRSRCLARIAAEGWELADEVGTGGIVADLDVSGSDKASASTGPACWSAVRPSAAGKPM